MTQTEIMTLDRLATGTSASSRKTMSHYLIRIAKLAGYLARKGDQPPCNVVMWQGLVRLADIVLGLSIAEKNCG